MSTTLVPEKIRQAIAILNELDLDCWITFVRETEISSDPMLAYVLGAHATWQSAFIVCRTGATYAIVGQGDRQTVESLGLYGQVSGYVRDIRDDLGRVLRDVAPRSIAVNFSRDSEVADGITHGMFLRLTDLLSQFGFGDRVVSAEPLVSRLRGRKSQEELALITRAIREALAIFDLAHQAMRPGITERQLAAVMLDEASRRGLPLAWSRDICPAVFAGPEARDLHAGPGDRPLQRGQVVYVDFGVRVEGYCSDLQRTFYLREADGSIPEAVQRGFDTLRDTIERARAVMRPAARGIDADRAAREHLVSSGYEEFPHALGHQVGRFAHDGTALLGPEWEKYGPRPFEPLEEGMVFTIEPRLFVPGRGTVSIEEMVVIRRDGAEYLSPPQATLLVS